MTANIDWFLYSKGLMYRIIIIGSRGNKIFTIPVLFQVRIVKRFISVG